MPSIETMGVTDEAINGTGETIDGTGLADERLSHFAEVLEPRKQQGQVHSGLTIFGDTLFTLDAPPTT